MIKVRLYGHFGHGTGFGRAATDLARALVRYAPSLQLDLHPLDEQMLERELSDELRSKLNNPLDNLDVVIVNTLPFVCDRVLAHARANGGEDAYAVAYTVWESAEISESTVAALKGFDAIWAPSTMSVQAFRWVGIPGGSKRSGLPVRDQPIFHCVDEAHVVRAATVPLPVSTRRGFLWIGKCDGRKNAAAILRTYVSAFDRNDPVELTMHMPGATEAQVASLISSTGVGFDGLPKLSICNVDRPREAIESYYANAHTYICAAHGEGFNFPAFDAMLYRRRVIAPSGQGTDDFLINGTLYPTTWEPAWLDTRPVAPLADKHGFHIETYGAGGLNAYCRWHAPDLNVLRRLLIEDAATMVDAKPVDTSFILETFGYQAIAREVVDALERIGKRLTPKEPADPEPTSDTGREHYKAE